MEPTQDPENYKLGVFYFNKDDKRIFPPKRVKAMGWTVNFANPKSIGLFVALIIILFLIGNNIAQLK